MKIEDVFTETEIMHLRKLKETWFLKKRENAHNLSEDFPETVKRRLEYQKWRIQTGKIQS